MDGLDLQHDTRPLIAQISRALRVERRRRGLSQREFALQMGISRRQDRPDRARIDRPVGVSRLARLETDAGAQSVEMVCRILMGSDFRLEVIDVSGTRSPLCDTSAAVLLGLHDASGRRFPLHLDAYRLGYPPMYWFVRNGGWNTTKAFPRWTYERRFIPRAACSRPLPGREHAGSGR